MQIEDGKVVTFHYSLADEQGNHIESSGDGDGDAMAYLHGHGNIVPGVEEALAGRSAGDTLSVTVPPEKGYGPRNEAAVQRVPKKHLVRPGRLAAGQIVSVNTSQGPRTATVLKVGHFNVDLDLNHPMAGRTLVFDIRVEDVREATAEELSHGHAHGPGGHQHD